MTTATSTRQRSGLALYFAVTFATTWACWLIAIAIGGTSTSFPTVIFTLLGGFGPVIGAIAVRVRRFRRREPVPAHTVRTRLSLRLLWVLPLLVMASATVLAAAFLAHLVGGPAVNLTEGRVLIATLGGPVPFLISMLIAGPLAEEPGWRGTAYPRLRASLSPLQAGLLLGVVWAIWHVPLFYIHGTVQAGFGLISWSGLLFTLSVIPMALLTGYAYERAGVVASIAVHLGVNATLALLTVKAPITLACILAVQITAAIPLLASRSDQSGGSAGQAAPRPHSVGRTRG